MRERIDPDQGIGNYVTNYLRIRKQIVLGRPYDLHATPKSLAEKNGLSKKLERETDVDTGYVIVGTNPHLLIVGGKSISEGEVARQKTITVFQRITRGYPTIDIKVFREKI